ncbi:MAG: N-acetyltransferase family protein [Trueperaceae bacterium]
MRAIYLEGIASGQATFQTQAPEWEEWHSAHLTSCRLVLRTDSTITGWAALSPVSGRSVYRGVTEVSIYIAASQRGQGQGRLLLDALVSCSEKNGIWTLQAGVFPENEASLRLHASCGFRVVGKRERIGSLEGIWRDVLLLERRSSHVGT